MFLSLKQRKDTQIEPENILSYDLSGIGDSGNSDYSGGTAGEFLPGSDFVNPLSPAINSTAGVDITNPAPGRLNPSAPLQPTVTQDPTTVSTVSTVTHSATTPSPIAGPIDQPATHITGTGKHITVSKGGTEAFLSNLHAAQGPKGASFHQTSAVTKPSKHK